VLERAAGAGESHLEEFFDVSAFLHHASERGSSLELLRHVPFPAEAADDGDGDDFRRNEAMTFSVFDTIIPGMAHGFAVLDTYLDHGKAFEEEKGLQSGEVLRARLAPDMLTFGEQFSVVASRVERHVSFLIGRDPIAPPKVEQTYAALKARVTDLRSFLQSISPEQLSGAESRTYQLTPPIVRGWFGGAEYIFYLVIPDFYFHVATAHAILRHLGARVGKRDYLGWLNMENPGGYS
jgi:hypothetical protein